MAAAATASNASSVHKEAAAPTAAQLPPSPSPSHSASREVDKKLGTFISHRDGQ